LLLFNRGSKTKTVSSVKPARHLPAMLRNARQAGCYAAGVGRRVRAKKGQKVTTSPITLLPSYLRFSRENLLLTEMRN
ncbi:MAG: hypothetical protein ABIL06_25440, partial [Pseudomonadota bacterium]